MAGQSLGQLFERVRCERDERSPVNFYRKKDSELVAGSADFSAMITAAPTDYGLVAAQAPAYASLNTADAAAYAAAVEPSTRGRVTVEAKNQARKNLVAMARQYADYIIANATVTNAQLIALGLDPRTERTPGPVPGWPPRIEVLSVNGRNVDIRLWDSQVARRGKPPGVFGAAIFSYVGATAPANIADWKFESNVGRTRMTVVFDNSIPAGATVWLTAFWFNAAKASGPACTPVSVTFGGVGASLADDDLRLAA